MGKEGERLEAFTRKEGRRAFKCCVRGDSGEERRREQGPDSIHSRKLPQKSDV